MRVNDLIQAISFGEEVLRIGIGNAFARFACTEAPPDVVAEVNITGLSPASTVILNINGPAIEIGEDTVVIHGSSVIANVEYAFAVTGILTSADQRCIIDSGFGKRSFGIIVDVSIVFTGISTVTVLNGEPELTFTAPPLIVVKAIITTVAYRGELDFSGSSEEFDSVIQVGEDFDELNGCSATNSAEGQSVDFVVCSNERATMSDGDVTENTAIVGIIVTAENTSGLVDVDSLDVVGNGRAAVSGTIQGSITKNDQPTPHATIGAAKILGIIDVILFGSEDNGSFCCSFSHDLATTCNDQSAGISTLTGFAFDDSAGFDGECFTIFDEDQTVENIFVISRPGRVTLNTCIRHLYGCTP